jgi:hypothetical protein
VKTRSTAAGDRNCQVGLRLFKRCEGHGRGGSKEKTLTPMAAPREISLVTRLLLSPYAMCAPSVPEHHSLIAPGRLLSCTNVRQIRRAAESWVGMAESIIRSTFLSARQAKLAREKE